MDCQVACREESLQLLSTSKCKQVLVNDSVQVESVVWVIWSEQWESRGQLRDNAQRLIWRLNIYLILKIEFITGSYKSNIIIVCLQRGYRMLMKNMNFDDLSPSPDFGFDVNYSSRCRLFVTTDDSFFKLRCCSVHSDWLVGENRPMFILPCNILF